MVEKFYYEILEQHLKQAEQIKPYREELEKNTKTFNELLLDVAFERPFKIFMEAEKPAGDPTDPAGGADPIIQGLEQGTQPTETPTETKTKDEVGVALKREINNFSRAAMFSYLVNGLAEKRKTVKDEDIIKQMQETPQLKSTLLADYDKSIQTSDGEKPLSVAALKEATPKSASKAGVVNKILVAMNTGSQEFKNSLADAQDAEKFVSDTYSNIQERVKQDFHDPQTALKTFFDSDRGGRIIHGVLFNQLAELGYGPDKFKTFAKLIDGVLNDKEKTFSKIFGSTVANNFTGDLSASDVVDVLKQTGKLDEIMGGAYKTLSGKISSLTEMLNVAANKVFQGQTIGSVKPALEERTLMDTVNDHVFFGDVSKIRLPNHKFYREMGELDAVTDALNKNLPSAQKQQLGAPAKPATTSTKQSQKEAAPKDQPQQPVQQQTKPDVNALSVAKNNAMRQAVAMITMATVMSFLSSFAQHFKSLVVSNKTFNEEVFEEGVLDTIAKGIGGQFKSLGKLLQNFTSAIPTNLNELSDQAKFNKIVDVLLKQAKNDEFKNILNQFNVSKQSTDFSSEIFNATVLNKNATKINEAIIKAKADTERALNQFNETSLHKIMQNAYLSSAGKGVKAAYKVAGAIDKFKTKMQGV